jgi:hypothetical protein
MAAVVSWYGPLIDLSAAASHVGGFVQLLAVVRRVLPHQVTRNPKSDIRLCGGASLAGEGRAFRFWACVYYDVSLRGGLFSLCS